MTFHLLLGVVHLVVLPHHASFHLLHQVPPDGAGCDRVDQVKNRQTGADQRVLRRLEESEDSERDVNDSQLYFLSQKLKHTHTHLEASDLRVFVLLAQGGVDPVEDDVIGHLLAIAKVRQDHQSVPECPAGHQINTESLGQVLNESHERKTWRPDLLISCHTSARVCSELPSFRFSPPMPTREKRATSLLSPTA